MSMWNVLQEHTHSYELMYLEGFIIKIQNVHTLLNFGSDISKVYKEQIPMSDIVMAIVTSLCLMVVRSMNAKT